MRIFVCIFLAALLLCCKGKKKNDTPDEKFFPVASYLKGQIAQMDSSLASIIKIEKIDSNVADTTYVKREEFKNYAKEFAELPDISSDKMKDDYQVKKMYDDMLKAAIITYETTEQANEIKKEDVILEPGENGESIVKTINIEKWISTGDSTVHKNMVWHAGKSFLIVTKTDKPGRPEKIRTLQVKWSG